MRRYPRRKWDLMLDGVAPFLGSMLTLLTVLALANCLE